MEVSVSHSLSLNLKETKKSGETGAKERKVEERRCLLVRVRPFPRGGGIGSEAVGLPQDTPEKRTSEKWCRQLAQYTVFCKDALCPSTSLPNTIFFFLVLLFSSKGWNSNNNTNNKMMTIIATPILRNGFCFSSYSVTNINQALYMHDPIQFLYQLCEVGGIIIPILQMRILRHKNI